MDDIMAKAPKNTQDLVWVLKEDILVTKMGGK